LGDKELDNALAGCLKWDCASWRMLTMFHESKVPLKAEERKKLDRILKESSPTVTLPERKSQKTKHRPVDFGQRKDLQAILDSINQLEQKFVGMPDGEFSTIKGKFHKSLLFGESSVDDLLPEVFAIAREAIKRVLGIRLDDMHLAAGIVLHQGGIVDGALGETRALAYILPTYLNALWRPNVHIVAVSDLLARRSACLTTPVFNFLGMSVGLLQIAARTENGKKAFLVDPEKESPHEDQHQLRMVPRREAYAADITYGTNSEFGFDYLRDNMTVSLADRVQRGHYFAIVDEVDNVLIDEARTPLILSGPASDDTEWYQRMSQVVRKMREEDYEISERDRTVTLTEIGETHVEELLDMPLRDPDRPEDVTPEQARLMGYLEQALRAQFLFKRNKDYLVQGGKVIIVDEFTGRMMPGRRWSDGLHQAVEAKENVRVQPENVTYATITIQNYFRMYDKLAGMTGTALTEAEEFDKIYKLDVVAIPTNLEYQAMRPDSPLVQQEDKDEHGYRYTYYAHQDELSQPLYWKRKDYPDVIFLTEEAKFRAIVQEILRFYAMGRPVLVGTTSVELSDRLSSRLRAEPLRRLAQVQVLRHAWMQANNREEDGRQIPELQFLNAPMEELLTSDLRKLAQSLEISLNPEESSNLERLNAILELGEEDQERLLSALKAGIPHNVLDPHLSIEESEIIAGAGSYGAVTIATSAAWRGVDIKLGGELPDDVLIATSRVLRRAGKRNPYEMQMEERRQALLNLDRSSYGIYETEVEAFLEYMQNMERVKSLGGLHVIGSERHEARRIDNQLRGRAAQPGNPGSSRFYLSLEDDLMQRFGGQKSKDLLNRFKVDEALPIESGWAEGIVEQSQTRVEGANFDIRKYLLEYDDVLNDQRSRIYDQRQLILVKDDLSADVTGMLRTEVLQRVPKALNDDNGPWELLAWMDQIQPAFSSNGSLFPSYTHKLLLEEIDRRAEGRDSELAEMEAFLEVAERSLLAEGEHVLRTVQDLLDQLQDRIETRLSEHTGILDTFFEGLDLQEETRFRQPGDVLNELSILLQMPLRLQPEEQRLLKTDPQRARLIISKQAENLLVNQELTRITGAVQRRLGEPLELTPSQMIFKDWQDLAEQVIEACQQVMERRRDRLLGNAFMEGEIARDIAANLSREKSPFTLGDRELLQQAFETAIAGLERLESQQDVDWVLQKLRQVLAMLDGSASEEHKERLLEYLAGALCEIVQQGKVLTRDDHQRLRQALQGALSKAEAEYLANRRLRMLTVMPMGTQTSFDRKTSRRISQRTIRLVYTYFAASLLEGLGHAVIVKQVLEHLEAAQKFMQQAWGQNEWKRIAAAAPSELDESTQAGLRKALGRQLFSMYKNRPLSSLPLDIKSLVIVELGRRALTELYRQLLLRVITELWVDYLTQMEGLRVSIGLEAYAQRDPLVQYKSKASELFQDLFGNMRRGVISRMFTFRPDDLSSLQVAHWRAEIERQVVVASELPETVGLGDEEIAAEEDAASEETQVGYDQGMARVPPEASTNGEGK
jgi:preprotein translocase subunit SecA